MSSDAALVEMYRHDLARAGRDLLAALEARRRLAGLLRRLVDLSFRERLDGNYPRENFRDDVHEAAIDARELLEGEP